MNPWVTRQPTDGARGRAPLPGNLVAMATDRSARTGDGSDLGDVDGVGDIDGTIAALYGGPLAEFVAQRDALARSLRTAGRRDEAARIKALKKPRALAWALDAGAHLEPDALAELSAAVEDVSVAQTSGGDVRAALSRLRGAETALVTAAGAAAAGHGHPVDGTALAAGLRAVVGDPDALAALEAGRLVDVPSTGGFGQAAPTSTLGSGSRAGTKRGASARRPSGRRSESGATDGNHDAAIAAARRAVSDAEQAARAAAADARTAADAADGAETAARAAEDEAVAARRRADAAAEAARQAREDADRCAARQAEADAALVTARDTLRAIGA